MQQQKRGANARVRSPEGSGMASRTRVRSPEGPSLAGRTRVRSPEVPAGAGASRVKSPEVGGPLKGRSSGGLGPRKKSVPAKKAGPSTTATAPEPRKKTWVQDLRVLSRKWKKSPPAKKSPVKPKKSEENLPSFMRPTMGSAMKQRSQKDRKVYAKKAPRMHRIATRRGKVKTGKDGKKVRRMKSIRISQSFRGLRRSGSVRSMTRMQSIKEFRRQMTLARAGRGGRLDEGPSRLADIAEETRSPSPFSDRRVSQEHQQPPIVEVDLDITDSAMLRDLGAVVMPVASPGSKEASADMGTISSECLIPGQGFGEEISDDEPQSDAETRESSSASLLRRSKGVVRQRTHERRSESPCSPAAVDQIVSDPQKDGYDQGEEITKRSIPVVAAGGTHEDGIPIVRVDDIDENGSGVEQGDVCIGPAVNIPVVKSGGDQDIPEVRAELGGDQDIPEVRAISDEEDSNPVIVVTENEGEPIMNAKGGQEDNSSLGTVGSSEGRTSPFVSAFGNGDGIPSNEAGSFTKEGSPFATAGANAAGARHEDMSIPDVASIQAVERENPVQGGDAEAQLAKEKIISKPPALILPGEANFEPEKQMNVSMSDNEKVSYKAREIPSDMLEGINRVGHDGSQPKQLGAGDNSEGTKGKALGSMRESVGSCEVGIVDNMFGQDSVPGLLDSHAEDDEEEEDSGVIIPPVQHYLMERGAAGQSWNLDGSPSMVSSAGSERVSPVVRRMPSDLPQLQRYTSEIGGSFLRRAEEQLKESGSCSGALEGSTTETTVFQASLHKRTSSTVSSERHSSYVGECSKILEESEHVDLVDNSLQGVRHTSRDVAIPYIRPESQSKSETPRRALGTRSRGFWWELGAGFVAGILTAVWLAMAGGCDACESDTELELHEVETVPLMISSAARPHADPSLPVSSPPICTGTHRDLQEEWLWHNE